LERITVAIMTWLTVTEYLCHKWPRMTWLTVTEYLCHRWPRMTWLTVTVYLCHRWPHMTWLTVTEYLWHKWPRMTWLPVTEYLSQMAMDDLANRYGISHGYVPFVVVTIPPSFPLSWLIIDSTAEYNDMWHYLSRNCLFYRCTWVHIWYFVSFVLHNLWFSVCCFVYNCLSLCPFFLMVIVLSVLRFTASDYPLGIAKLFLIYFYKVFAIMIIK
jgi:hypothetical protein